MQIKTTLRYIAIKMKNVGLNKCQRGHETSGNLTDCLDNVRWFNQFGNSSEFLCKIKYVFTS
jgi:hypothetical protein